VNNHRTNLEQEDLQRILDLRRDGVHVEDIAEKFDVHPSTVFRILQGKHWLWRDTELPLPPAEWRHRDWGGRDDAV
jgi:transposase-like protein